MRATRSSKYWFSGRRFKTWRFGIFAVRVGIRYRPAWLVGSSVLPYGVISETTPEPLAPPPTVVPYRLPLSSRVGPAMASAPSGPVKRWRTA